MTDHPEFQRSKGSRSLSEEGGGRDCTGAGGLAPGQLRKLQAGASSATGLESTPTPSTSTSTTSPGTSHLGGLKRAPAPLGVPVRIRSPASRVVKVER